MQLPHFVQIEPVGQCNLRCQMCPIQFRRDGPPYGPPAYMDFDVYKHLINQFPALTDVHLQGLGEPMMHPRYFDMVAYAADKGIKVSTNSNFTLLDRSRAERLVRSGLDTIHISIDGATKETYERIRVWGRFKKVLRHILYLNEAKKKLGRNLPHIRLVMVIMRQNLAELPALVRLAARLSIPAMFVQHLAHDFKETSLPEHYKPMREYVDEQTLLGEEENRIMHYFNLAHDVAQKEGVDLRLPFPRMHAWAAGTPGRERCDWPWRGAYISYQGLAMPCCMVATPDRINFGSMVERPVQTVWDSAAYARFRQDLESDQPHEICRSCSIYSGSF